MKLRNLFAGSLSVLLLAGWSLQAADTVKFSARSGSKMRIEGTANMIHTRWAVESPIIGGTLEAGPGFPTEPGQAATPGKVDAKVDTFIMVRSLKSVEDNGKPYSDKMDDIMYEKMKADKDPRARITYHLTELVLKEPAKSKDAPYVFDSKGELQVAGVTNTITMPVNVLPLGEKKMKISGTVSVKMSDFKIESPAPKLALGMLKTGDEVKLIFDWNLGERPAAVAK
ncbi:MAG TPA: YceI family protein [Verrucomicrobiae bacterium]